MEIKRQVLKVAEAAEILGCHRATIYKMLNSGELEEIKRSVGRKLRRIPMREIERFLANRESGAGE